MRATAAIRAAIRPGSVFLTQGLGPDGAEALTNGVPATVEVRSAPPLIHQVAGGPTTDAAPSDAVGAPVTAGSDAPGAASEVVPEPGEAAREANPAAEGDRASGDYPNEADES